MIMDFAHYTTDQWITFGGVLVAVCAALGLAWLALDAYRTWTAPAALYRRTATPAARPTLMLTAARHAPAWVAEVGYDITAAGARLQRALIEETQQIIHPSLRTGADVADALQPGVGSLADLPAADPDLLTEAERAELERVWVAGDTAIALAAVLDAALRDFRAAVEPAMRKAHLWALRGEEGSGGMPSARAELAYWRIDTPTGEYALVPAP